MSTGYSPCDPQNQAPRPNVGSEDQRGATAEEKSNSRTLLAGDPLARIMGAHPLFVGTVFLVLGWGSLLLIAWRLEIITSDFLRNPAFMVGDLVLLPLAGALMAAFYRSASFQMPVQPGRVIALGSAILAAISAGATAAFSIFVSETYHGLWSVPHTLFIWLFAYTFISFLPRAFLDFRLKFKARQVCRLVAVALLPTAHLMLKSFLGGSLQ